MSRAAVELVASTFPATFGLRAYPGAVFRIGVAESYVRDRAEHLSPEQAVALYTQRLVDGEWLDFAKGAASELRAQLVLLAAKEGA